MSKSSILGAETSPAITKGRNGRALGPSDLSDSGADAIGLNVESDSTGTGERAGVDRSDDDTDGADIAPDYVVVADEEVDDVGSEIRSTRDLKGNAHS